MAPSDFGENLEEVVRGVYFEQFVCGNSIWRVTDSKKGKECTNRYEYSSNRINKL